MNLRLDILCKSKVVDNDEEMQRAELVNELLLNNLLPMHVGKHFMNPQRHSKVRDDIQSHAPYSHPNIPQLCSKVGEGLHRKHPFQPQSEGDIQSPTS